jgi:hypothetical protein
LAPRTTPTDTAIRQGLALLVTSLPPATVDEPQVRAYLRGLRDVPPDVILEAVDAHLLRMSQLPVGKRFFPTVPDWLASCAGIVNDRRQAAARQARALQEDCPDCRGTGWADTEGPNSVLPCRCKTRAVELMNQVTAPIRVPQLPPAPEEIA